jgi:hypothetical protein
VSTWVRRIAPDACDYCDIDARYALFDHPPGGIDVEDKYNHRHPHYLCPDHMHGFVSAAILAIPPLEREDIYPVKVTFGSTVEGNES